MPAKCGDHVWLSRNNHGALDRAGADQRSCPSAIAGETRHRRRWRGPWHQAKGCVASGLVAWLSDANKLKPFSLARPSPCGRTSCGDHSLEPQAEGGVPRGAGAVARQQWLVGVRQIAVGLGTDGREGGREAVGGGSEQPILKRARRSKPAGRSGGFPGPAR